MPKHRSEKLLLCTEDIGVRGDCQMKDRIIKRACMLLVTVTGREAVARSLWLDFIVPLVSVRSGDAKIEPQALTQF